MDFKAIQNEYNNFYAPNFMIRVGKKKSLDGAKDILKESVEVFGVTVNNSIEGADDFSFTVNNPPDDMGKDFKYIKNGLFEVGNNIEIKMGYGDRTRLKTILIGLVTSVDFSFPANGISQLTIKGFNNLHLMMKGKHAASWGNSKEQVTYSYVVNKIITDGKYKFNRLNIEKTLEKFSQIKQDINESDYEFIKSKLANKIHFEVFVQNNDFYFRTPANNKTEYITTLKWRQSLLSFSPSIDITNQVSEVHVHHWSPNKQEAIVGIAKAGEEHGRDKKGESGGEKVKDVVRHFWIPVASKKAAEDLAKSILDKLSAGLVTGNGECIGIPDIMPGKNIKLEGLGEKFSKSYYIDKTTHSISSSGYKTTFSVKENMI